MFPIQIALNILCPNIFKYSPSLRHVITIDVTCPWIQLSITKWATCAYHKKTFAQGISLQWNRSLRIPLYKCFNLSDETRIPPLPKKTKNKIGRIRIKSFGSFYIRLAQNNTSWEVELIPLPTEPSPSNQASPEVHEI